MQHREEARRFIAGVVPTLALIAAGVVVYLLGSAINNDDGYYMAISFPLITSGLTLLALPVLLKAPGHLEAGALGRTLIWIGPMSLAVLIMNEPFRFIEQYLFLKGQVYSLGWWLFIVVFYVPGTLILGAILSRLLRLTPPNHPTQLLRDLRSARSRGSAVADTATKEATAGN